MTGLSARTRFPLLLAGALVLAAVAEALEVELTGLDGTTIRGQLQSLTPEVVLTGPRDTIGLDWSEILEIKPLNDQPLPPATGLAPPLRIALSDGSRVLAAPRSGPAGEFEVDILSGQTRRVELTAISEMMQANLSDEQRGALDGPAYRVEGAAEDVAVIRKGAAFTPIRGTVRKLDEKGVTFRWKERELSLPWDRVAALRLASPTGRGASAIVRLRDGQALAGRIVGGDDDTLRVRSSVLDEIDVPWALVERVECRGERLVYLSDLEPSVYECEPLLGKRWDFARDQSLSGGPLKLGGRTYAKGLTMHSPSHATFALGGRARRFAATVGILDEVAPRGAAAVRIVGDGRLLWEAADLRPGRPPEDVALDVTGVGELTLIVDIGADLDIGDHVAFAMARLTR